MSDVICYLCGGVNSHKPNCLMEDGVSRCHLCAARSDQEHAISCPMRRYEKRSRLGEEEKNNEKEKVSEDLIEESLS